MNLSVHHFIMPLRFRKSLVLYSITKSQLALQIISHMHLISCTEMAHIAWYWMLHVIAERFGCGLRQQPNLAHELQYKHWCQFFMPHCHNGGVLWYHTEWCSPMELCLQAWPMVCPLHWPCIQCEVVCSQYNGPNTWSETIHYREHLHPFL